MPFIPILYILTLFLTKCTAQIYFQPWENLPPGQKEAADCLGYNKTKWNCYLYENAQSSWWTELSYDEQVCATVLGYDERSWNILPTPSYRKVWNALTFEEKDAAKCLGYNDINDWDNGLVSNIFLITWNDLSASIKPCAQTLGFRECSWNLFAHGN